MTTPESEAELRGGCDADAILAAGPRLSPLERLELYRQAYYARLIECLADDYPALQIAIGYSAFEALCRAYIERFPSTGPNLNFYGRHMNMFCRTESPGLADSGFAADLASLEWAIVEVIHAASASPLPLSELARIPVQRWEGARLIPTPAFRLLRFEYPVNPYFQAFRDGAEPRIPSPSSSAALVYRNGPTVWRMNLTEPMFALLDAIASGRTLGAAMDLAAPAFVDVTEEVAASQVMIWFRDWVDSGLFASIDFLESS